VTGWGGGGGGGEPSPKEMGKLCKDQGGLKTALPLILDKKE
jgi:hypothetical protein